MDTKVLLSGIAGLLIGGLIVSIAATLDTGSTHSDMSMTSMNESLAEKSGTEFDAEYIEMMIVHHEGAIEMAKLSMERAERDEIKQLSAEIIEAQQSEIEQLKQWRDDWGLETPSHSSGH